jgi:D-sedoheptulose 7-phosphate isomerase
MDLDAFFDAEFREHEEAVRATRESLREPFRCLVQVCTEAIRSGHKIVLFGNGGSAADAQHLATELSVRFSADRAPIAGLAFTTDTSTLTAIGNDMGFDDLFARQVEAHCRRGDVAIGLTTSGRSRNVTKALETARRMGVIPAALGGRDGGDLVGLADPLLVVPSAVTARIQELHITLGHMLCAALEQELGLVQGPV